MRTAIVLPLLVACAAPPRPSPRTAPEPVNDAAVVVNDVPAPQDLPPPVPAHERVAAMLPSLPVVPPEEAAWLPSRVLGAVFDATGELPAPTPPRRSEDRVTWSLVAAPEARSLAGVCEALGRFDARVACAVDAVTWAGSERPRLAVGWRAGDVVNEPSVAQPLRALSRLARGVCVVSIQRTLRTLDLTVRAPSPPDLGRTLAMLATAPGLRDLILVRSEARNGGIEAVLSWPIERVRDRPADMGEDPWPGRCDGASSVGEGAPANTLPTLRAVIAGRVALGAVLAVGRQEWLLTAGDRAAGATIVGIDEGRVTLRVPGRPRPVVLRPLAR